MKPTTYIVIILSLLVGAFFFGRHYQRQIDQAELVITAAESTETLLAMDAEAKRHEAEADRLTAERLRMEGVIDRIKADKGKTITRWRTDTTHYVTVDTVVLLECDSAIAVGNAYRDAFEITRLEAAELRQVATIRDSMVVLLWAENNELKNDLNRSDKRLKTWQGVTGVLAVAALILAL